MAESEMRGFPAFSDPPRRSPFTMAEQSKICILTRAGEVGICRLREGCWLLGAVLAMGTGRIHAHVV